MASQLDLLRSAISRRRFLGWLGAAGAAALLPACRQTNNAALFNIPPGQTVARLPEKTELIMLTDRPPQLETPLHYFKEDLTPNEAFFVRWHNAGIPTDIDTATFKLKVKGHVQKQLDLSLADLRNSFPKHSLVAVCQCSGNSRSLYEPRVPGGQWGNGAMGNARWTGVRLKDVLQTAGIKSGAIDVTFAGLDEAPLSSTPKFVKSLPVKQALCEDLLIAYEMNGASLPMVNGFPLRLVVPGWYATYWVKALNDIEVLPTPFKGFWMEKAYRIPNNPDANETPEHWDTNTVPINRMSARSIFVSPADGGKIKEGTEVTLEGVAFDDGSGIEGVDISVDGGNTWLQARLSAQTDRFSWRRWKYMWQPGRSGRHQLLTTVVTAKGRNNLRKQWNHSGYMRNIVEQIEVDVV